MIGEVFSLSALYTPVGAVLRLQDFGSKACFFVDCILKDRTLTVPRSRRRQNRVTMAKNSHSLGSPAPLNVVHALQPPSVVITRHLTSVFLGVPLGSKPSEVLTALIHLRHSATGPAATRRHSPRGRSQILSFNVFIDALPLRKARLR